jgi:hypothetical protein
VFRQLPELTPFDVYRFCQLLKPSETDDCVNWCGTTSNGYGLFKIGGKNGRGFYAHRLAYWLATGVSPPTNLEICHRCNNRRCCNPDHLYLGTHKENMEYAAAQNRMQGAAKVTEADVLEIRRRASEGTTTKELAKSYVLAETTIRSILAHRTWKSVGGPKVKRKGGSTKLSQSQRQFIRKSSQTGATLAKRFNVSPATISNIRVGK